MVFKYIEDWVNRPGATPLSQSLPLRKERFSRKECRGFAMLEQIGGECAGAVTFIPAGQPPPERNYGYRNLSSHELASILKELPTRPLLAGDEGIRLSLAGAQDKIALRIEGDEISLPPRGRAEHAYPEAGCRTLRRRRFQRSAMHEPGCGGRTANCKGGSQDR
jgi:serine/threonine-protein kinase HipA